MLIWLNTLPSNMYEILAKHGKIIKHCAKKNPKEFNQNKALEEALEFSEALIKRSTKHPDNPKRPDREEFIKEYGDMVYRGMILLLSEFPEHDLEEMKFLVEDHIEMKLADLEQWKKEKKYTGGL